MNWENDEPQSYYDRKEKEHMEMVMTWALAILLFLAGAVAVGLIIGAHFLAKWLLGGG